MVLQCRAPVRQAMRLNAQHAVVIFAYDREWHHSTIVQMTYVSEAPEFVPYVTLTMADGVELVVPADRVLPLTEHILSAPVSYRVRWEPLAERAYPAVWQQMADDSVIVYDQLIIGERRVV